LALAGRLTRVNLSGYVWWVDAAFGNFWAFMMGWISWASGVVDNAIYPG
jgi:hypothetical protein